MLPPYICIVFFFFLFSLLRSMSGWPAKEFSVSLRGSQGGGAAQNLTRKCVRFEDAFLLRVFRGLR